MKKLTIAVLLVSLLCYSKTMYAQGDETAKYVKYEKLSIKVNDLQSEANHLKVFDGQKTSTLTFPNQNFKLNFHDRLASTATYLGDGTTELVEITEKIDFSKAIAIETKLSKANEAGIVAVIFPKGLITTMVYKGGSASIKKTDTIHFYTAANTGVSALSALWSRQNANMYNALIDIIFFCKREAKQLTEADELSQRNSWSAAFTPATRTSLQNFIRDAKSSIYYKQALKIESVILAKQRRDDILNSKMDSVALLFKFKWGLTGDQFKALNPEAAGAIKHMKSNSGGYEKRYSGIGQPFPEGPWAYVPDKWSTNKGVIYSVVAKRSKIGDKAAQSAYDTWMAYFKSNFPPETITEKDGIVIVTSPNSTRTLTMYKLSVLKVTALLFTFGEASSTSPK